MKKKLFVLLLTVAIACIFAISVSAITTYDDAPVRENIQISTDDVIVFDDGFVCPSAYVFKDVTRIEENSKRLANYLDFSYIEGKREKTYTADNIVAVDIPQGITYVGRYTFLDNKVIKRVSFPDSVTGLGNAIFQNATGLEECVLEHNENSTITKFPSYMFYGCSNLKAFSMPDCFTELYDVGQFTKCGNMTAVHLSKNLTKWQTGGGGSRNATFDDCNKMYFVNEAFTYDAIPEKPDVYYFPANLQSNPDDSKDFSKNSTMRECLSLNQVVVFGTKVTSFTNAYFFQNAKLNVVFLGDMQALQMGGNWDKATFYFTNSLDKSVDDVTIGSYTAARVVFCNAEGNTTHIKEKALSTEANCINPKMLADYCFCGAIMGEPQTEGTALGHNYTGAVSYVFDSLITDGKKCTVCVNGCGIDEEKTLGAVYTALGYSVKTFGTSYSFVSGYDVNVDSLALYEQAKNVELQFGFAFNAASTFTEGDVTLESFKIVAPVAGKAGDTVFSFYQYQMSYTDDTNLDADIVIAAYVIEKSEDSEALTFINRADGTVNGFNPVNYNKALELAE